MLSSLHHPLSRHFVEKHKREDREIGAATNAALNSAARIAAEEGALLGTREKVLHAVRSPDAEAFLTTLLDFAIAALGGQTKFRRGTVSLGADEAGVYWAFPPAEKVEALLWQLHCDIKAAQLDSPFYAAIIGLVNLNCIHPFMDGNGRTSRILFNALLINGGLIEEKSFIPCKHIYALSNYGYEIRLRQLILKNDWVPVVEYFTDVIDLFCAIAKQDKQATRISN
jgi:Fic family protein